MWQRIVPLVVSSLLFSATSIEESTIPVLDMQDYYSHDKHGEFVEMLSKAFQQHGFFAVINAPIDQKIIDDAYCCAKQFFALSIDEKMQISGANINAQRGYSPLGTEIAKSQKIGDMKEFLMIGREMFPEANKRLGHHLNIWPETIQIKLPMVRLYNALEDWMIPIEHAIEETLQVKKNFLNKMTFEGDNTMRVVHYPKECSESKKFNLWSAEHTDINLFTIIPKSTAEGLEFQSKDGKWVHVVVPEDAFIVNCGDMLENLTNGYFHSVRKRVVHNGEECESHHAIVLYVHARNNDRLDPLPQCIEWTGGKKKYPQATRWELLMERLADMGSCTREMLVELSKSGLMERMIEIDRASPDAMYRLKEAKLASPEVLKKLEELESSS